MQKLLGCQWLWCRKAQVTVSKVYLAVTSWQRKARPVMLNELANTSIIKSSWIVKCMARSSFIAWHQLTTSTDVQDRNIDGMRVLGILSTQTPETDPTYHETTFQSSSSLFSVVKVLASPRTSCEKSKLIVSPVPLQQWEIVGSGRRSISLVMLSISCSQVGLVWSWSLEYR